MVTIALLAGLLCVLAPIALPLPGLVPISFTSCMIYIIAYVVNRYQATLCVCFYVTLGIFGIPVFSGYTGGIAKLIGPTGGFILCYILSAWLCSTILYHFKKRRIIYIIAMTICTICSYVIGATWYVFVTQTSVINAIVACIVPFIIPDTAKIIIAIIIAPAIKKQIS